jgi:serine/threonine protein kinase
VAAETGSYSSDRFELLDLLGAGGMAQVYRAHDKVLGREVALKLLNDRASSDSDLRQRLVREARAAASLKLATVVQVHDIDPSGRFIVMELVRGQTLAQRLKNGRLPTAEVRRVARALLTALSGAHALGIVHRDVKPSNLLLTEDGAVKLTDFGVALVPGGEDLTRTGNVVGTLHYMAPEQLRGATGSVHSDIYSTGVTLFEAATGDRFHDAGGAANPDPYRAVYKATSDRKLAGAIARAVSHEAAARFDSADAFLIALDRRPGLSARTAAIAAAALLLVAGGVVLAPRVFKSSADAALEEGLTALSAADLARAYVAFQRVLLERPSDPLAAYYYSLTAWWIERPPAELDAAIHRALRLNLEPKQRGVLEGIRLLEDNEYPRGRTYFEDLASRFPNDRDVTYGLFEARYHGGAPAEAMQAHEHLLELDPGFSLGEMHALSYHLSHGYTKRVRELLKTYRGGDGISWLAQTLAAERDYDGALKIYEDNAKAHPNEVNWRRELFQMHLVRSEPLQAETLLVSIDEVPALKLLFAVARADATVEAATRVQLLANFDAVVDFERAEDVKLLMIVDAARAGTEDAEKDLELLQKLPARTQRAQRMQLGEAFQHARLGQDEPLRELLKSPYPEVVATVKGLLAEREGRYTDAVQFWREAIIDSAAGELDAAEGYHLALAEQAAGNDEGAVSACDAVVHPLIFQPGWARALQPCLELEAAAQRRLGHEDEAAKVDGPLQQWRARRSP